MAAGADGVETASRMCGVFTSGGLDDLARAQAARADAEALDAAVDHRADPLQVRLEPAGSHVVRVADVAADHRALVTDFAALRHVSSSRTDRNGNCNTALGLWPGGMSYNRDNCPDREVTVDHKPTEYFKELVESAVSRQQLRANELTTYYLVDLLCRFMRPDQRSAFSDDPGEPLALRLRRALESGGLEQRARLRNLGDFSLFMSGFFADSFRRRVV